MSRIQPFTPAALDNLKSGKLADPRTPGLSIEVAGGGRLWRYRRRVARINSIVKLTLGSYPAFTVADARDWADGLNAAVERGEDPRVAMRAEKAKAVMTVEHVHGLYIAAIERGDWKKLKPRTLRDKGYIWTGDIQPHIAQKSVFDLTPDDLWELVENKGETSPVRANRLAVELKCIFGWAASRRGKKEGIELEHDPARTLESKWFAEGEGRERFFEDDEIMLFFRAVAQEEHIYRRAMLLWLITGVRKLELLEADSAEQNAGTWVVPGHRTKNGLAHDIVLGPWGRALFAVNTKWAFPSSVLEDGPMVAGWYKVRDRIHARMEKLAKRSIEPWVIHDLRRTMRSNTDDLGIREVAAEAMMNHAKKGLVKIYARKTVKGKAEGFALWERRLISLARRAKVADALEVPS